MKNYNEKQLKLMDINELASMQKYFENKIKEGFETYIASFIEKEYINNFNIAYNKLGLNLKGIEHKFTALISCKNENKIIELDTYIDMSKTLKQNEGTIIINLWNKINNI